MKVLWGTSLDPIRDGDRFDGEVFAAAETDDALLRALPPDARVVAVRTTGLWGSIWSRKGRTASPAFGPTLVRSFLLWLFAVPFMPRRRVTMRFEDITARAREWANGTRLDFNHHLEDWYNDDETDAARAR